MKKPPAHKWLFSSRFRRQAYGWHSSSLAVQRVKEALREIRNAAAKDPLLGAEGAVLFLEKVSPALEQVDSSSGAIGTAVNQAIEDLVPLIVAAPADDRSRDRWLKRLEAAVEADDVPYAENSSALSNSPVAIARTCEEILLSSGLVEEAYRRYALLANQSTTYLNTFRALVRKYPHKGPEAILQDLIKSTPGNEGKWFAAAKSAGFYETAIELANQSPCDPKTLTRASIELATKVPRFALEAGLAALRWLVEGYGYEITGLDVWKAFDATMKAADLAGCRTGTLERIRRLVGGGGAGAKFVAEALGTRLV